MSIFGFFDFSNEKKLAAELADFIAREVSPKQLRESAHRLSINAVTRSIEKMYQRALEYKENQPRMGLLRRSVLANQLKWSLRDKGYSDDFVDMATEGLVIKLASTGKSA